MKASQDRQKIYTYKHRVRERKISLHLGSCANLSPRYHGPFEVLEIIGSVAYRLAFPAITRAHNVFHVYLLKK